MSLTRLIAALPEPLFSKYSLDKVLGVGAYAVVYRVRHKRTNEVFALKVIEIEPMRARLMLPQLDREISLLTEFSDSPHVVPLLEVTRTATHVFLRFELCQANLEDLSWQMGAMREEDAFAWLREACMCVQELHSGGVVHRDLKPSNLLIDADGLLRICDFGWACWEEQKLNGTCGTPEYSCLEARMRQGSGVAHTNKVDIYALGACFQHLLLGRVPKGPRDLPKGLSAATLELLVELLDADPEARPTVDELLQRPQLMEENSLITHLWSTWQSLVDALVLPSQTVKQKNMEAEAASGVAWLY